MVYNYLYHDRSSLSCKIYTSNEYITNGGDLQIFHVVLIQTLLLKKKSTFVPKWSKWQLAALSTVLCQGDFLRVLSSSKILEILCKYNQFVNLQIIRLWGIFGIKIYFCLWSIYPAFLCVFFSYKFGLTQECAWEEGGRASGTFLGQWRKSVLCSHYI